MIFQDSLLYVYEFSIFGSAAIATYHIKWLMNQKLALFVPYLWMVFLQEFLMIHFYEFLLGKSPNIFIYNIYRLITVLFFSYLFLRLPMMAPVRKYIAGLALLFVIAFGINFTLNQTIFENNGYFGLARGFVVTCIGLLFLFCYFQLDNRKDEKNWSPWVWIASGMIIFYPVTSISQLFSISLQSSYIFGLKLYNLIAQVMSIFMYSSFSFAFYLCRKRI